MTVSGVSDPDGEVFAVDFYRDTNGNGRWDEEDELLGEDNDGSDGWSLTVTTAGWHFGTHTMFARALDNDGAWSDAVSTTVTIPLDTGFEVDWST
jgi:hypothetical protein